MKFEHLIEINDPLNPLIESISRIQLWRGLVLRAEQPGLFIPHLDGCEILERGEDFINRSLRFGELVVKDTVSFIPQLQVRYTVPKQGEIPASHLVMQIEQPDEAQLFVRFEYDDHQDAATDAANAVRGRVSQGMIVGRHAAGVLKTRGANCLAATLGGVKKGAKSAASPLLKRLAGLAGKLR